MTTTTRITSVQLPFNSLVLDHGPGGTRFTFEQVDERYDEPIAYTCSILPELASILHAFIMRCTAGPVNETILLPCEDNEDRCLFIHQDIMDRESNGLIVELEENDNGSLAGLNLSMEGMITLGQFLDQVTQASVAAQGTTSMEAFHLAWQRHSTRRPQPPSRHRGARLG